MSRPFTMIRHLLMTNGAPDPKAAPHARIGGLAHVVTLGLVALAYFGSAKLGFMLASATKQVTVVWPPTGIATVAFLLLGTRIWPAVYLGAFTVNITNDEALITACGIAFGNTLGPAMGALALRRWVGFDVRLQRVRDVLALVGIGAALGMALTATNGVIWLTLAGAVPWAKYLSVWWVWWLGDAMGVLVIAPLLLAWIAEPRLSLRGYRLLEWLCLFGMLCVAAQLLFSDTFPLTYGVFPFAVWAALRFGQRETALVMVIIAMAAVWGVTHDRGPFALGPRDLRLDFLVLFMGVMSLTALVLAAVTAERRSVDCALQSARDELEHRVKERTTELARANESLRAANQQHARRGLALAAKQAEAESFVYVVSHDLRAPLVNIQGFSEELHASCRELDQALTSFALPPANKQTIDRIVSDGIGESLRYIAASTTKLQHLIDALLVLSRTGREQYAMQTIDIDSLVKTSVSVLQQSIEKAGMSIEVGLLPSAYGDQTAVGQVFTNLIGNAIKYRKPGPLGAIVVAGELQDDMCHFWVRDNGAGLGANAQKRLFQAFQRFHPQLAEGEGMGLAIVKRVVERHGGRVWAESVEGSGATFHFTLPASFNRKQSTWRKLA